MNSQERDLLTAFLANLAAARIANPDQEALAMIRNAVAMQPDATYLLVQQALMQQAALGQAQAQIEALQQQARDQPGRRGESSFLGGGWSNSPAPAPQTREPFGAPATAAPSAPQRPSRMGEFLRGAATTAAGVAGGALLFQGIENLLGGHHGGGFLGGQAPIAGAPEIVESNTVINEYKGADPTTGPDEALLGSPDLGWGGAPDGNPDPFADLDPFGGQDFGDDPSDWA